MLSLKNNWSFNARNRYFKLNLVRGDFYWKWFLTWLLLGFFSTRELSQFGLSGKRIAKVKWGSLRTYLCFLTFYSQWCPHQWNIEVRKNTGTWISVLGFPSVLAIVSKRGVRHCLDLGARCPLDYLTVCGRLSFLFLFSHSAFADMILRLSYCCKWLLQTPKRLLRGSNQQCFSLAIN